MTGGDARDLGVLLQYALTPRVRPGQSAEYRRLVQRLQQDVPFANSFHELADGLGLFVLAADDYGVVLGCRDDSSFALRLTDFRAALRTEDRVIYGLIVLALGAWCFPRADELDAFGEGARRVEVGGLTSYVVGLAETLAARSGEDSEADHPELRAAWRLVLEGAHEKPTADARRTSSTLAGKVKYTLEFLAGHGLLVADGQEAFRTTRALRTQLRELAANEAFALVRAAHAASEER
ncbi:MAG: hypothetical protein EA398_10955 [Deltaproteobacteria bacterium]|nr:MAG: hypothetical protein EA398_10955 [Deltaproteobacteria bacterium]